MPVRRFRFDRFAALLLLGSAGLYAVLAGELYFNQVNHVYHPEKEWAVTPASEGMAFEEVSLTASDGVRLSAWYIPAEPSLGTVLVCHGNARNMSGDLDVIQMFHALGYHVLIVDYRGFGKSEGRPDEEGTYRDAQAAWDWLVHTKKEPPERIVVCGRSLGGAVAAEMARRNPARALMVEAAFTSLPAIGQELYPYFPVKFLSRFRYDTLGKLEEVTCPVLIIHSREDELIDFRHAERLHAAVRGQKILLEIGGPHKGGYEPTLKKYYQGVRDFLKAGQDG
jgi:fermentation-respiration switch protein FrsA (DUF1100 family)